MILPAAGFGTRVGSPEAKEMLWAEGESFPMIQHALDLFADENCRFVVPTRKKKKGLIEFLARRSQYITLQLIETSAEWPDTVLQTEPHWLENNLLVLPDTRWSPVKEVLRLTSLLGTCDFSFSTFAAENPETWGVFRDQPWSVCDKPPGSIQKASGSIDRCWGHIAFKRDCGRAIFSSILKSHSTKSFEPLPPQISGGFVQLDSFCDLTRPNR